MIRIISLLIIAALFTLWAIYKVFIARNATKQDMTDIKLGFIFLAVAGTIFYFIFS